MNTIKTDLASWGSELEKFHLPRWEALPDFNLYMDQVIQLIDQYLSQVIQPEKHTLLTPSMVNNYVKLGLIPAPQKKRYTRKHVAFLIAITMLKQILTIPEIKDGIIFQGKTSGIQEAYNIFCQEQEQAIYRIGAHAQSQNYNESTETAVEFIAVRAATSAFAMKMLAEKTIALETTYLKEAPHE
ncbi:DUF1836 domain-containing protein [Enterococcus massiliensis]|uniref:DUF1836 domain-containing protein n=1 Tax=Enterococcus massiliensis TaxID=1640685 RepID=UPI00065E1E36|nr:DUF1836 domain-containing protein [Enterococcus massiliensis]